MDVAVPTRTPFNEIIRCVAPASMSNPVHYYYFFSRTSSSGTQWYRGDVRFVNGSWEFPYSNTSFSSVNINGIGSFNCLEYVTYKPEYKEFIFPLVSIVVFFAIVQFVYHLIIKRLLP